MYSVLNSAGWNKPRLLTQASTQSSFVRPVSISTNFCDSLYNTGGQRERECFQPIREFFPRQVKFHQPQEKSKYLLLRLFPFSVCRPCGSERDAGPLDFSGVYRLLWERWRRKTWVGICLIKKERVRERWCLCNLLFLRCNTWFMCSKKADFLSLF